MSEHEPAPAGWYEQPKGSGSLRWWDGRTWSDDRVPVPAAGQPWPAPPPAALAAAREAAAARAAEGAPGPAPKPALVVRLRREAEQFRSFVGLFTLLTLLGALAIGYLVSQETVCSRFSCETETNGGSFAIGAIASFVGGMLFVLPLRGIAALLEGVADLVGGDQETDGEASGS